MMIKLVLLASQIWSCSPFLLAAVANTVPPAAIDGATDPASSASWNIFTITSFQTWKKAKQICVFDQILIEIAVLE